MIYLDSSVVLAWLFAEDRVPAEGFWSQTFVASRLLEYEVFNRVHARGGSASHGAAARRLIDRVQLLEMSAEVLSRALLPFAPPVRTLDALHLASLDFLRARGLSIMLATYDERLGAAARSLGFTLVDC